MDYASYESCLVELKMGSRKLLLQLVAFALNTYLWQIPVMLKNGGLYVFTIGFCVFVVDKAQRLLQQQYLRGVEVLFLLSKSSFLANVGRWRRWSPSLSRSAYSTTQSAQLHYISELTDARLLSSAFDEAMPLLKIPLLPI